MQRLTADKKIASALTLAILAAALLLLLVPSEIIRLATAAALLLAAVAVAVFVKKRSIHSFHKRQVLWIVSASAGLYLTLYYLTGLDCGFAVAYEALSLNSLLTVVLPLCVVIASSELIRSMLLAGESRFVSVLLYLALVCVEILAAGGIPSFSTAFRFADFVGMTLLPAMSANLLYHALSRRYGWLPNVVFRAILTLYPYLIPVVPNLPRILPAFSLFLLPFPVLFFIKLLFESKKKRAKERPNPLRPVLTAFLLAVSIGVVAIISCQFRFGVLVIASPSMSGAIEVGDAVLYESYDHCDPVEEQTVVVFESNGKNVVHRVVAVNAVNGERRYTTKGDANEQPDSGYVTDDQIVGVVRARLLYVGIPSLWLYQIFN